METDNHYLVEGLFIIAGAVAVAFFAVWLAGSGHRDDVLYRIHFAESVSGLSVGDPVKFHGVDIGNVKTIELDPADPRLVQVDVRLRKYAPIKTDTKATLKLKGITGTVFIELDGGSPKASTLVASTREGQVPEIASEKGTLTAVLDLLPKLLEKFAGIENQVSRVVGDVGSVTSEIKENPSLLLRGRPEHSAPMKTTPGHR
jgi:phospholipid/cholesterol/gamma-HCH transport system substrate-binding protein